MATIIDGKRISGEIRAELADKTKEFQSKHGTVSLLLPWRER